jgi:restriction system protein
MRRRTKIREPIVYGKSMPLNEWLAAVRDEKNVFPSFCFPTADHRKEFADTISQRSEKEVRDLIRQFLIPTCTLGCDDELVVREIARPSEHDCEYFRRLRTEYMRCATWEGLTWVLDLLPGHPRRAIEVLFAYFVAHCQFLPDGRAAGLQDAEYLIRTRYISACNDLESVRDLFLEAGWRKFEQFVAELYRRMGYETELTPPQKEHGRDVIATRLTKGMQETVYVQCKLTTEKVGIEVIKCLESTVRDARVTRGVVATISTFTKGAKEFARRNSIELLDGADLILVSNEHLGSDWPRTFHLLTAVDPYRIEKGRQAP